VIKKIERPYKVAVKILGQNHAFVHQKILRLAACGSDALAKF